VGLYALALSINTVYSVALSTPGGLGTISYLFFLPFLTFVVLNNLLFLDLGLVVEEVDGFLDFEFDFVFVLRIEPVPILRMSF
jgi:hypothetical protein